MLSDKCSDLKGYVNELQRLVDGIKNSLGMTEHMPNDLAQALHFLTGSVVTHANALFSSAQSDLPPAH